MIEVTATIKANDPLNRPVYTAIASESSPSSLPSSEWERVFHGNPALSDLVTIHAYPGFHHGANLALIFDSLTNFVTKIV